MISAKEGDSSAQNNLGLMYDNGNGVVQNYKEAVKWYRKAAEQGFSSAQNNLGIMYKNGKGVVQNYIKAHMYYNLAASQGNKSAQKNRDIVEKKMTAGQIKKARKMAEKWRKKSLRGEAAYDKGFAAYKDKDYKTALKEFMISAKEGHYKEAVKWVRKPAEQGDSDAQYTLGVMYANGQGVVQNYIKAHMYWNLAANQGNEDARKNRDIVEKRMTVGQIKKAQEMAEKWRVKR